MADFRTHVAGAAAVSGSAVLCLTMAGAATQQSLLAYFLLGVLGGLLPDVDSDSSIPIRVAFSIAGIICGFLAAFAAGKNLSLAEVFAIWLVCYLTVRHAAFTVFARYTVHRGLIHSIPAAVLCGLITTVIADRLFAASPLQAWFCGAFVILGFVVHLILDEAYSVDLMGMQWKRSFGTALTLGSLRDPIGTLGLYAGVAALSYVAPPTHSFLALISGPRARQTLTSRLLPDGVWFAGLF